MMETLRKIFNMKQLIVIETIQAKPGKTSALKQALLEMVPFSLKEKGCLQYEIAESEQGKEIFLVLMRWENIEALEVHNVSTHVQEFVKKYDRILYGEVQETLWLTL